MLKNKTRLVQILLVIAIFSVLAFYYVGAASNIYTLQATGDYVTSNGLTDIIDIEGLKKDSITSVRYEVYKGTEIVNEEYNLEVRLLDKDGNSLSISEYPYIYFRKDGYFNSEITMYIDLNKYIEFCQSSGKSIEFLNQFKLQFYTVVTEDVWEDEIQDYVENIVSTTNIEVRDVKLYEDGSLCNTYIDAENSEFGEFIIMPMYLEEYTSHSEINFTSFDEETNTYEASLNINMGAREDLKNFAYKISLMSKDFPNRSLLVASETGIVVTPDENNEGDYLTVSCGNTLRKPTALGETKEVGDGKYLIIEANRNQDDEAIDNGVYKYQIVLNTFSRETLTINLTINLNYEKRYTSNDRALIYRDIASNYRNFTTNVNFYKEFSLNFVPYKIELLDSAGNIIYNKVSSIDKYYIDREDTYFNTLIDFGEDFKLGFYTLNFYEVLGARQYIDGTNDYKVPTEDDMTLSCSHAFYVEDANIDFSLISNGKEVSFNNKKEGSLDIFCNSSLGKTNILGRSIWSNDCGVIIDKSSELYFSNSYNQWYEIEGIEYLGSDIYSIEGNIPNNYIYILNCPSNSSSFVSYKVNLKQQYYAEFVLSYLDKDDYEDNLPITDGNEKRILLTPTLIVNGKNADMDDYEYSINILDAAGNFNDNGNVWITKEGSNDYFCYNNFGAGTYLIRCSLVDYPHIYVDKFVSLSIDESIEPEEHNYRIEFLNSIDEVAVPNDYGKQNQIKLNTKVYMDEEETNIVPTFSVIGDTQVSTLGQYLIIKNGAIVGNSILVTASLNDNDGNVLATETKVFYLVAQNENNDDDIIDTPTDDPSSGGGSTPGGGGNTPGGNDPSNPGGNDPSNPGGGTGGSGSGDNPTDNPGNDSSLKTPVRVELYYNNQLKEDGEIVHQLTKTSGDELIVKYVCYDEDNNVIENPAISIEIYWDEPSGLKIIKDYPSNEIAIYSNGVYTEKNASVYFLVNEDIIGTGSIQILPSTKYVTNLYFVQDTFIRGSRFEARAKFTNNSIVDVQALLVIVCYDENDKMVTYNMTPVEIKAGKEFSTSIKGKEETIDYFSSKISLPNDIKNITVKAFLLEGTNIDDAKGYFELPITMTNKGGY